MFSTDCKSIYDVLSLYSSKVFASYSVYGRTHDVPVNKKENMLAPRPLQD